MVKRFAKQQRLNDINALAYLGKRTFMPSTLCSSKFRLLRLTLFPLLSVPAHLCSLALFMWPTFTCTFTHLYVFGHYFPLALCTEFLYRHFIQFRRILSIERFSDFLSNIPLMISKFCFDSVTSLPFQ